MARKESRSAFEYWVSGSILLFVLLIFLFVYWISGSSGVKPEASTRPSPSPATNLKPEMFVMLNDGKFPACATPELLQELSDRNNRQEITKMEGMFQRGQCAIISNTEIYQVLSITPTLVEFRDIRSNSTIGVWAVSNAFHPVKYKPAQK